jgi:hypothetical protein
MTNNDDDLLRCSPNNPESKGIMKCLNLIFKDKFSLLAWPSRMLIPAGVFSNLVRFHTICKPLSY